VWSACLTTDTEEDVMLVLTRAAARAVAVATRRENVPALRVRLLDGSAHSLRDDDQGFGAPLVVSTAPTQGPGPGETAVRRGAATVYLPAALTRRFDQAALDLHQQDGDETPRLVLRASTREPGARAGERGRTGLDPR
jgi:hypothetical protein